MRGPGCSRLMCTKGWVRPLVGCFWRVSWEAWGSYPWAFLGPVGPLWGHLELEDGLRARQEGRSSPLLSGSLGFARSGPERPGRGLSGALEGVLGASWEPLGGLLGGSWGAQEGPLEVILSDLKAS